MGHQGKIAWGLLAALTGMNTFYRVVAKGLRLRGWQITGLVSGLGNNAEMDQRFADEYCEVLVPGDPDLCRNAAEFARRVAAGNFDVVYQTGELFSIAAAPALPSGVRLVSHCVVNTRRGYELASANLSQLSAVVVETPRQRQDLIRDWGIASDRCVLIPGGIEIGNFEAGELRDAAGPLRLISVGRLDDAQKAILILPKITSLLVAAGLEFHLDILGDGPDRERLTRAFSAAGVNGRVTLHGTLRREDTLPFLQRAHLFLLPSRYEGLAWSLIEAMACGCVPVVSRIAGTTDFVVEDGINGRLCTVGKASEFAQAIRELNADRSRLAAHSRAARETVGQRFLVDRVVDDHDALFQRLLAQEPPSWTPIPIAEIGVPRLMAPTWRRFVPQPLKNYVRTWAERLHRSV